MACAWGVALLLAGSAGALPTDRHYEMVSPLFKGGYGVNSILAVAPSGDRVAFSSLGAFAGTLGSPTLTYGGYIASRGANGWSVLAESVPGAVVPETVSGDYSSTLESALVTGLPGSNAASCCQGNGDVEAEFLLHATNGQDTPASWQTAGSVLKAVDGSVIQPEYEGASPDLCHIFFSSKPQLSLSESPPPPGASTRVYELQPGCDGTEAGLHVVNVSNNGQTLSPHCEATLGTTRLLYVPNGQTASAFNAIADGGSAIFFTSCIEGGVGHQVFARLGGARTIEVSRPTDPTKPFAGCGTNGEVPCPGAASRASAQFAGANEAGSLVFLTTTASLSPADTDSSNDLYVAHIGCPEAVAECAEAEKEVLALERVSNDVIEGQVADVQGVVRVAPDGSRIYFVARGTLSSVENSEGSVAVAGADNLYVYDVSAKTTAFIAALCSGPGRSGIVIDPRCPSAPSPGRGGSDDTGLFSGKLTGGGEAQTAGAGGDYLVFSSFGRLTADDANEARDVFRYDAVSGSLVRVSVGEEGFDANGNDDVNAEINTGSFGGHVTDQYEMGARSVSEDGSRIVFSTARPLSPGAINHTTDVYEWKAAGERAGEVSLISGGRAVEGDFNPVISPSGTDVFFVTVEQLVPADTDSVPDVYDARLGESPAPAGVAPQPCSGESCRGPLVAPEELPVPGSVFQAPGQNFTLRSSSSSPSRVLAHVKRKKKHKKHKGRAGRRSRR